jgi:hypothetical protein
VKSCSLVDGYQHFGGFQLIFNGSFKYKSYGTVSILDQNISVNVRHADRKCEKFNTHLINFVSV